MNAIVEKLGKLKIVPVVILQDERDAEPLAQALLDGGLPTMEITFRTDAAKAAITRIAKSHPSIVLGAGTVLTVDQVKAATDAGARYIVSPGISRSVVEYCLKKDICVTPGVVTPTEIGLALELGLDVVKFFPAEASGGIDYLKAISAPFPNLKFIPTGGIDESNLIPYLQHPKVLAVGGSWMVKPALIAGRQFGEITRLTAEAVEKRGG
jgi:2-dehydro-3-deoxyphosphogluconate aldolase/(4S)-4-hydroxy-2-oxoglutarate aldolase